ncbi:ArnT family glycosyltransferase [Actinoplanes aureus]|uniref:Glycosyltransferase family 39 protein n=1 Tax=Actinoplanes aureus TaxID=2792083 RepID=A0A931FZG8_9ACTN|nr:glycosyltransferase family 39 protein [Actinoplanes aureus]MBG0565678.1 glycosyltransferase family 39 protein [Actinoplanes aureus]
MITENLGMARRTEPAPPTAGPGRRSRTRTGLTVAAAVAVVLALRLVGLTTSYDIFVDEHFYAALGRSVAAGHLLPDNAGQPFLLHPPGFFWLEALWSTIVPIDGGADRAVYLMRALQEVMAAASAVLIFFLAHRLAGFRAAVAATALFAIDAYILRQNARVLLETTALTFVLAGYLQLVRLVQGAPGRGRSGVLCGVCFGAAVLTKDMAVLITTVPLLLMAVTGWCGVRRQAIVAAAAVPALYVTYSVVVVVSGHGAALWTAKTSGFARLLGTHITTGFNAPHSPSLSHVMWSQLLEFGGSYALIGAGTLAGLWLLVRPVTPAHRVLGLFTSSAAFMVAYDTAFGTIEEHFLYYLAVPALISAVVAGAELSRRVPRLTATTPLLTGILVLLLALDATAWVRLRSTPDNGHSEAMKWLLAHAPAGSRVAWVAGQTELSLLGTDLVPVPLGAPSTMASEGVSYLVTLEKLVDEGYTFTTPRHVDWYAQHGTKVFSKTGRSYGEVAIYQTIDRNLW